MKYKNYTKPELEVRLFELEDVLTPSACNTGLDVEVDVSGSFK